ncbi:hypothetical protein [Ideonella sp.]|jgi:hypothetical protein|uniref:hypothetical protein n=1 Tax=Ideonella sp. TaxID=1929293 RepID=UPI0037C1B0E3
MTVENISGISPQYPHGGIGSSRPNAENFQDLLAQARSANLSDKDKGLGAVLQNISEVMEKPHRDMALTPVLAPYMSVSEAHEWSRRIKGGMAAAEVTWHTTMACASSVKSGLQQLLKNQ